MPIEIRELIIRTSVTDQPRTPSASQSAASAPASTDVEAIVAKVTEMLRKKNER